jgi:transposase
MSMGWLPLRRAKAILKRLTMKSKEFEAFLTNFAAARPNQFHIILLDNARSHHATLQLPNNIALLFLPPYAPELNPCERVWQAIKDHLAWRCFPDLVALHELVADLFITYEPTAFHSLVAYPFLVDAITQLTA